MPVPSFLLELRFGVLIGMRLDCRGRTVCLPFRHLVSEAQGGKTAGATCAPVFLMVEVPAPTEWATAVDAVAPSRSADSDNRAHTAAQLRSRSGLAASWLETWGYRITWHKIDGVPVPAVDGGIPNTAKAALGAEAAGSAACRWTIDRTDGANPCYVQAAFLTGHLS
jgi:hypothetical protein